MRILFLLLFGVTASLQSEVPEGFVSLFNGKDLTGWRGNPEYWSVENGAVVGVTGDSLKRNSYLIWDEGTVKNFELRVKVRIGKGGNSGLQYRSRERPDLGEWILAGYQCDVLPGAVGLNGMFYEELGRRILGRTGERVQVDSFGMPWVTGKMEMRTFPAGEWCDYRILVQGNHHQHWIDGHQTADAIDGDERGRSLEGLLGMQVHVGSTAKVEYRDFWLKRLPDDLPLRECKIPETATLVRPQQKLPANWKAPQRGTWKESYATETVKWDQLARPGFAASHTFRIDKRVPNAVFRVWFGGPVKAEFSVRIDGETVWSGRRVNPTWQFLEIPLSGPCEVKLLGPEGTFWAEPSLWSLPEQTNEN